MNPGIAEWSVMGHERAVSMLQRALSGGEVSHAYLITGATGIGKTTLAFEFAAALFCESGERRPCGVCRGCLRVAAGSHPDLHLVESASSGAKLKIEQIRALRRQLALTPGEGSWRVAILQRFEEATVAAANALLKNLEEPPSYVIILVLARDVQSLLPTIVSRCQHIPLRPQPVAVIQHALMSRWGATPEKASILAHLADGRLGWAVQMLQDPTALGWRDRCLDDLNRLLAAPATQRFQYAGELAKDVGQAQEVLGCWLTWWRDVMLCSAGDDSLLANIDHRADLYSYARTFGVKGSAAVVEAVRDTSDRIQHNANLRLALEVLMLELPTR